MNLNTQLFEMWLSRILDVDFELTSSDKLWVVVVPEHGRIVYPVIANFSLRTINMGVLSDLNTAFKRIGVDMQLQNGMRIDFSDYHEHEYMFARVRKEDR